MSELLIIPGNAAFSEFRIKNLTASISEQIGSDSINSIDSTFVHYIALKDNKKSLEGTRLEQLKQLLDYDTPHDPENSSVSKLVEAVSVTSLDSSILKGDDSEFKYLIVVLPRTGTISPWSSKATNIAHVSGFVDSIDKIERGFALLINSKVSLDDKWGVNYALLSSVFDRMTESLYLNKLPVFDDIFLHSSPKPLSSIKLVESANPLETLQKANETLGLAFDKEEIEYLVDSFVNKLKRNPTDVELFMFAQINSEHCRHKIFNANWVIDGESKEYSLFKMVKTTHTKSHENTISAYSDNSAVFAGSEGYFYAPNIKTKNWELIKEKVNTLIKVETHNHPTAISPFAGAATGSGGEIRDEGATGKGSKPKAGLAGFSVSNLEIPGYVQPWEKDFIESVGRPDHIASPLEIMIQAPIGSAAFNNEFGRPCIVGYFRTLTTKVTNKDKKEEIRGFHKPIMLAGGLGAIRPNLSLKDNSIKPDDLIIVLGGQSMLIGLGGGAASSVHSSDKNAELDFASVQRGNPEMERRAQEVINACASLDLENPILSIHDVGAGGLSNALPELVHDNDLGAVFQLRKVLSLDPSMSPLEIWCNESQERYVLAIRPSSLELFEEICNRERCPYAVIGHATKDERLVVEDDLFNNKIIDLDMSILFGNTPKLTKVANTEPLDLKNEYSELATLNVSEALSRVLRLPSVGSKSFLISIGDRTVGGVIDRDQFVGPWQVPVADVGVTATSLGSVNDCLGEAMAMGEKPVLALISASASAKMCVAEALTNLLASDISKLSDIKISANWMSAANYPGEGSKLYEAVEAICLDLCSDLGIAIPVGKDSLSMKMNWKDSKTGENREVVSPLSLVITAFGPVINTTKTWTPELQKVEKSVLVLVDLSAGQTKMSLGGSAFLQVYNKVGDSSPSVYDNVVFKGFLESLISLHNLDEPIVHAYHDRSDGGLIVTLLEMAFAARSGIDIRLASSKHTSLEYLFNEELGAVFQISEDRYSDFVKVFAEHNVPTEFISIVGTPVFSEAQEINVFFNGAIILQEKRSVLQQQWSETSYEIQRLRDNPSTSFQEFENIKDDADPGLYYKLSYNISDSVLQLASKPKVAILREQGVNGHFEMAWCFQDSGFTAVDVHMSDIVNGNVSLDDFVGLAACGGFSYGDVLGAGNGWAKSILFHEQTRKEFIKFFQERKDTFAFGACNGCQFLSRIQELIPGSENWPTFERNFSEQYEGRVSMVKIEDTNSIFLQDMAGSEIPIVVAHGEGRATFKSIEQLENFEKEGLAAVRFIDNYGKITERYPFNPNGSPDGITGIRNANGRVLATMPHPERICRLESNSYYPKNDKSLLEDLQQYGPWIKLFRNARKWVG